MRAWHLSHIEALLCARARGQASSAEEELLLSRFKEVQLRMRDGEVTDEDWEWLHEHCSFGKRVHDMQGPNVFRLVLSQKQRDDQNAARLEQEIEEKRCPHMKVEAVNSHRAIAEMDDDVVEIPNELYLCLGARVLITKNLSIKMGIVNGTLGVVHDIVVNSSNKPVAVLVRVKRAQAGTNGYSGPLYMEGLEGVDDEHEAVIPIGMYTVSQKEGNQTHTRMQFPLMLAYAINCFPTIPPQTCVRRQTDCVSFICTTGGRSRCTRRKG